MQPSLIIVSNRLPLSVKKAEDGSLEFYPSVGGLATGLSSYTTSKRNKWIGWPGVASEDVTDSEKQQIISELKKHNCYPVFLTKRELENYYNGYSNSVLWPVFHELKPTKKALEDESYWRAYKRVNEKFADAVLALSGSGSTIWVHDYQLLLLPALLRRQRPADKIGFFLHIPFPGIKALEATPHSKQLLLGLIGSDLIGFHTNAYVSDFLDNCQNLGIGSVGNKELILPDRVVRITDFPMGIDYGKFARATKQRAVKHELVKMKRKYHGRRVILTVDRLDPTKGLVERLKAYQHLLRDNKKWHRKVVMVMLAVPSRTEIDAYKSLKNRLEKLVTEVNDEFGTTRWQPVDYMYQSMPFEQLSALYQLADVAFIAPIKDGMNLVAKEYIASRRDASGVLVLSETAGAAEELQDAIQVDPKQTSSLVSGLSQALSLPKKDLQKRVGKMQDQLSEFTVQKWAGTFMDSLKTVPGTRTYTHSLSAARISSLRDEYRRAKKRLLLLDYDGVLVGFKNNPYKAVPSDKLLKVLRKLAAAPNTDVVIVSGRSKADLSEWFDDMPVALAAEHGAFTRTKGARRWQTAKDSDNSWRDTVLPLLEEYDEKTPGAHIEVKDAAIVWHYRQASPYYAQKHLVILKRLLGRYARKHDLVIHQGNMILEIRGRGATKGTVARQWLDKAKPTFVLTIGDDYTDEDMFEALPDWAHSVKVGRGRTAARLRLQKAAQVLTLLEKLAK